mmetsp:Transcript_5350/g.9819  ORF Transcript_5350/g.9819 Transcript_5350/m.9819 type:complete len:235 (-) Transcript_5350:19-723(-)
MNPDCHLYRVYFNPYLRKATFFDSVRAVLKMKTSEDTTSSLVMLVSLMLNSGEDIVGAIQLTVDLLSSKALSINKKLFLCRLAVKQALARCDLLIHNNASRLVDKLTSFGSMLVKSGSPHSSDLKAELEMLRNQMSSRKAPTVDASAQTHQPRNLSSCSESTQASPIKQKLEAPSLYDRVRLRCYELQGNKRLSYLKSVASDVRSLVQLLEEQDRCLEAVLGKQLENMERKYCS